MDEIKQVAALVNELEASGVTIDVAIADAELRLKRLRALRSMTSPDGGRAHVAGGKKSPGRKKTKAAPAAADASVSPDASGANASEATNGNG